MRPVLRLAGALTCLAAAGCGAGAGTGPSGGGLSSLGDGVGVRGGLGELRVPPQTSYGRLPLSFAPNVGQAPAVARFVARASGVGVALGSRGLTVGVARRGTVSFGFPGARRSLPVGQRALPGRVNYLLGNDRSRWRTGVPTFARVRYPALWPGVDAVFYGNGGQLEYDFVVAPGADPRRIALRVGGERSLRIDRAGSLAIGPAGDAMRLARPRAYQVVDGRRVTVASRYVLAGRGLVRFALGRHDPARALVIDPVLVYSTYLGGDGSDVGHAIAVDGAGSAYVAGSTASTNFPTVAPYQPAKASFADAFVAKLNPSGSALVYSTYLGGGSETTNSAKGIAVDAAGNAYVTGATGSGTFPTTPTALQTTAPGGFTNAFLTRLNSSGSALLYSTYLGGATNQTDARAIALDSTGHAYLTGLTNSSTFPTTVGAFQTTSAAAPNNGDA
ncbi:MAG: hypothetical protein QOI91_2858, partial [Solirubrobacteraceae bacterium]|nr:hypothetical protein [Solirubrobacteraceae bacterium]